MNVNNLLCGLIVFLSVACTSNDALSGSDSEAAPTDKETTVDFSYEKGTFAKSSLPYRKGIFSFESENRPALVFYLHGGSSTGDDNQKQMQEGGIDSICNYLSEKRMNAIFIVPQCPSGSSWVGTMSGVLRSLIATYTDNGSVDARRIYIFGGSMGGTGTWNMLSMYPGLFAAAMPVAGNPSNCDAENIAQTPVYTVLGTADNIMYKPEVIEAVKELEAKNPQMRYDEEEGWTHEDTCIRSYTKSRLEWVFEH